MSECYLHWPNFESMQLRIHSKLSLEPIAIPANSNYHQTSSNSPRYFLPPTSRPSGSALGSWQCLQKIFSTTIVCRLIMPGKIALLINIRNCFKEPPKKVLDNTVWLDFNCPLNQSVDTAKFVPSNPAAYQWIPGPPGPHLHTGGKVLSALSVWKPREKQLAGHPSEFKLQPFLNLTAFGNFMGSLNCRKLGIYIYIIYFP